MAKKHAIAATGIAAGSIAFAVLLGAVGGQLGAAPDQRIRAIDDAFASTDGVGATRIQLVAGGMGGGAAVSYLKFEVGALRTGRKPARAEVRLTKRAGELPGYVELSRVPATGWSEDTLDVDNAPRLGSVVASARPARGAKTVSFDVTRAIAKPGTYAFAVTVPAGAGLADFFDKDGLKRAQSAFEPSLGLSWRDIARPAAAPALPALPDLPGVPDLPDLPDLPGMPAIPSFPMPSLPGIPPLPPLPTLPPGFPTPPGWPTPPTPTPSTSPSTVAEHRRRQTSPSPVADAERLALAVAEHLAVGVAVPVAVAERLAVAVRLAVSHAEHVALGVAVTVTDAVRPRSRPGLRDR